eukprot:jgi/Galph1/5517/GphlegSOOS_G4113.1
MSRGYEDVSDKTTEEGDIQTTVNCYVCKGKGNRAAIYWLQEKVALCKICDKKAFEKKVASGSDIKQVARYNIVDVACSNCLDEISSVLCVDCSKSPYCSACDPIVHKARSKASHQRVPLDSWLCNQASVTRVLSTEQTQKRNSNKVLLHHREATGNSEVSRISISSDSDRSRVESLYNFVSNTLQPSSSTSELKNSKTLPYEKALNTDLLTSDEASGAKIRQLIGLVHDSLDVSIVEKILVIRSTITEICNDFLTDATNDNVDSINFTKLAKHRVSSLGIFGSHLEMGRFLYKFRFITASEYNELLQKGEKWLATGIYVVIRQCLPLILFTWLPSSSFQSPSMKDISCNFVRYLQELCNLILCLPTAEEWERFRRLSFSEETNEVEREIFGSVELQADKQEKIRFDASVSLTLPHDSNITRCFLSDGVFRHAVLTERDTCIEREIIERTERFSLPKFHGFISDKSKSKKVHFQLSNDEFLTLLKYGHESGYARYQTLCQSLNESQTELQKELSRIPELVTEERDTWVKRAIRAIDIYCAENFPSEERLVRAQVSEQAVICVVCNAKVPMRKGRQLPCKKGLHTFCLEDFQTLEVKTEADATFLVCSFCGEGHQISGNSFIRDDRFMMNHDTVICEQNTPQSAFETAYEKQQILEMVQQYICLEDFSPKVAMQEIRERYCLGRIFLLKKWGPAVNVLRGNVLGQKKILIQVLTSKKLQEWYSMHSNPDELREYVSQAMKKLESSLLKGSLLSNDQEIQNIVKGAYMREKKNSQLMVQRAILNSLPSYGDLVSQKSDALRQKYRQEYEERTRSFLEECKEEMSSSTSGDLKLVVKGCAFIENGSNPETNSVERLDKRLSLSSLNDHSMSQSFDFGTPPYISSGEIVLTYEEEYLSRPKTVIDVAELQVFTRDVQEMETTGKTLLKPCFSSHHTHILIDTKHQQLKYFAIIPTGAFLTAIYDNRDGYTRLYVDKAKSSVAKNLLKTFKSHIDLLAVDELSRYVALYDSERARVDVYRFDELWQRLEKTPIEIHLDQIFHDVPIRHMFFLLSKSFLIFIDEEGILRSFEFATKMFRPRTVYTTNIEGVLSAPDGSCFFLLKQRYQDLDGSFSSSSCSMLSSTCVEDERNDSSFHGGDADKENQSFLRMNKQHVHCQMEAEVYIGGGMQYFGKVKLPADVSSENIKSLKFSFLASQLVLFYLNNLENSLSVSRAYLSVDNSLAELVTSMQNSCILQDTENATSNEISVLSYLQYVFLSMDKFCLVPVVEQDDRKSKKFLFIGEEKLYGANEWKLLMDKFYSILEKKLDRFVEETRKVKDAGEIPIRFHIGVNDRLNSYLQEANEWKISLSAFIKDIICLVPLQIARAEANTFRPMINGLREDFEIERQEILQFANCINFGLYDSILRSWQGPIKVVSSMGKQSTGKSYMLNHLTGSLFDIAGGRCTDGVWMSMRIAKDCLYVILDFEGLGSFERSEQEDMLLSVFQAAISNLTLYKTDLRFDRDTQATFTRFQSGVSLVRGDPTLFRGRFYIVMKDVESRDVSDLQREFLSKLRIVCRNNGDDNFLTKMYQGQFAMAAFPTLGTRKYYEQLSKIYEALKKQPCSFQNGKVFRRHLQLLMSKLCTKDWTPLNRDQILLRISELRYQQTIVLNYGKLQDKDNKRIFETLCNLDNGVPIPDQDLSIGSETLYANLLPDEQLELSSDCKSFVELSLPLVHLFEKYFMRGRLVKTKSWQKCFQEFLHKIVERRIYRIQLWLDSNLEGYPSSDGDILLLRHGFEDSFSMLRQQWELCGFRCSRCYLSCLNCRDHMGEHNCLTSHRCEMFCDFCKESRMESQLCGDVAGHGGRHDCKLKNHTCGMECSLSHLEACNYSCALPIGHSSSHKCNAEYHLCGFPCELLVVCHETWCPHTCMMAGCNKPCAERDNHFHDISSGFVEHFCGLEHPCPGLCNKSGICQIVSELRPDRRVFRGALDEFEYTFVTEQNGLRRKCALMIPSFRTSHEGECDCRGENEHFCDVRCPSCGYFCIRPYGHAEELHHTNHGNMRACHFVSDEYNESVEVGSRKYKSGESGEAEMCNMYCKELGRGHIHLMYCNALDASRCTVSHREGIRHQTISYGPDFHVPKDELTHEAYWKTIGFVDPCTKEEREIFALCSATCGHPSHQTENSELALHSKDRNNSEHSFCTLPMWHEPLDPKGPVPHDKGFISANGHHFICSHSCSYHAVFLLDRGASMATKDCSPTLPVLKSLRVTHRNRLGCAIEAIYRYIMKRLGAGAVEDRIDLVAFKEQANVCFYDEPLSERLIMKMVRMAPLGNALLDCALEAVVALFRGRKKSNLVPIILIITDGNVELSPSTFHMVDEIRKLDKRTTFYVVKFGRGRVCRSLEELCQQGEGQLLESLDEIVLLEKLDSVTEKMQSQEGGLIFDGSVWE